MKSDRTTGGGDDPEVEAPKAPMERMSDGVLRMRNKYCSDCLRTRRFLDLDSYLVCECCSKRLERIERAGTPASPVRQVPWAERPERRRPAM